VRDLASRLRAIVETERARSRVSVSPEVPGWPGLPGLEDPQDDAAAVVATRSPALAETLGGTWHESSPDERGASAGQPSACLVIDRTWDPWRSHGRRRIHECAIGQAAPVGLFDRRIAAVPEWASKLVFFDIETTGLSGGAGTMAFLAGCGWFGDEGFTVRQFLLTGPAGEHALLESLEEVFDAASVLVTFNGRTFDVPTMEMRWAFHRQAAPTDDLPHFDMLPVARRLWGFRPPSGGVGARVEGASCSLTALERSVLQFHRVSDVPGFEIPARYFYFLRTGDASVIHGVLEHNRHDLVSLAVLTAHALWLAEAGPDACREPVELIGLGRCYDRAGDVVRAEQAFALAAASEDHAIRASARAYLAESQRRSGRIDEAATTWQRILDDSARAKRDLAGHERRAAEALAIYLEHRAKDPAAARRYAESLHAAVASGPVRRRDEVAHRIARLNRKIARANDKGGLAAAPLLDK
jgi:uncharacterized protein YprB with RNaseH-like and TPR domain